jgi:hypothetical protein
MGTSPVLAVLQSGIALAGLLLIFSGFLISKAESYQSRRADIYKRIALATLFPIIAAIALSWISVWALEGSTWSQYHLLTVLKVQLALTGAFAIIGLLMAAS